MRSLQPHDLGHLAQVLGRLEGVGNFNAREVSCAMELLQTVADRPDQRDYQARVVDRDGVPVGFILYGAVPLTDGTFEIYWIAVDPLEQGQGFGRLLLEAAEADLKARGARMICLETASKESYARTRAFYLEADYRIEAVIADFYVPGDDMIKFVKRFA